MDSGKGATDMQQEGVPTFIVVLAAAAIIGAFIVAASILGAVLSL